MKPQLQRKLHYADIRTRRNALSQKLEVSYDPTVQLVKSDGHIFTLKTLVSQANCTVTTDNVKTAIDKRMYLEMPIAIRYLLRCCLKWTCRGSVVNSK